jgi:hypothetical protein
MRTYILIGNVAYIISRDNKRLVNGAVPLPDGFWSDLGVKR